jgi:hypothetical protein
MVDGWLRGASSDRGGRGERGSLELEKMATAGKKGKRVAAPGARAGKP